MGRKTHQKLADMLKSGDKEMCNLASTLFCAHTKDYEDYFQVRTLYDPQRIHVENIYARGAFNMMFNHIDRETIPKAWGKHLAEAKKTTLSSQQKRQARKRGFNR
jgi:hypothetical protein